MIDRGEPAWRPASAIPRRRLLQVAGLAVAAGTAAALAACGDDEEDTTSEDASDVKRLNAFRVAQLGEVVFFTAIAPELKGPALTAAQRFGAQSNQQAAGLVTPIADLGGKAVELSPAQESAQRQLASRARGQAAALDLAVQTKNSSIAVYFEAVTKIFNDDLRATAGQLITCSAEQRAVLIGLQSGNDPRQEAAGTFVTGGVPE